LATGTGNGSLANASMATPLHPSWRYPEDAAWRDAATDPPPDPPAVVLWLEHPPGMAEFHYRYRVETGAPPTHSASALP
jgi:hypothetical protein